jgi:hypothetical protein
MANPTVSPQAGFNVMIVTGGTAVVAIPANAQGGYIINPYAAADQNVSPAEPLYVDPVASPGSTPGTGNGTTRALGPGEQFNVIPYSTTPIMANAATAGHKFVCVWWP